ncbi:MAG: hypothetical protein ACOCV1_02470 [Bacillota bacterium]
MNNFKNDIKVEKEVGKFLDKYLYSKIEKKYPVNFIRTEDEDIRKQKRGVDITAEFDGNKKLYIDEKAATDYIDQDLDTFVLEISFVKDGRVKNGWFIKEGMDTQAYLFNYIKSEKNDKKLKKFEDIKEVESILVDKSEIINFYNKKNLSRKKMKNAARKIRNKNWKKAVNSKYLNLDLKDDQEIYFYYTPEDKKEEQPINLLIPKIKLVELSRSHYVIKKQNLKILKSLIK